MIIIKTYHNKNINSLEDFKIENLDWGSSIFSSKNFDSVDAHLPHENHCIRRHFSCSKLRIYVDYVPTNYYYYYYYQQYMANTQLLHIYEVVRPTIPTRPTPQTMYVHFYQTADTTDTTNTTTIKVATTNTTTTISSYHYCYIIVLGISHVLYYDLLSQYLVCNSGHQMQTQLTGLLIIKIKSLIVIDNVIVISNSKIKIRKEQSRRL